MAKKINRKAFAIAKLRRGSFSWPPRNEAKIQARVSRGLYKCAKCNNTFSPKEIRLDHINPVVPISGWDSWDGFIERLLCDASGFQVLCINCHNIKSDEEDDLRKKVKK